MDNVVIAESDFNYILSVIGIPFVDLEEDGIELNSDQIKEYVVGPSMEEYYRWFPQDEIVSVAVSTGPFSIPYPTPATYGLLAARRTKSADSRNNLSGSGGNPFITHQSIHRSNTMNKWGSRYDYGLRTQQFTTNFVAGSQRQGQSVFRVNDDREARVAEGYYSLSGYVQATFAQWNPDFSTIPFEKRRDVMKYCQAELLLFLGHLRNQVDVDFPVAFDADAFISRGEDLRDEVVTRWKGITKGVVLRGSRF